MKINLSHIATPLIVALMTVGCTATDETVKLNLHDFKYALATLYLWRFCEIYCSNFSYVSP